MKLSLEVRDERICDIIDPTMELQAIAEGFEFIEGPVWHRYRRVLIFSDIPADTMYQWSARDGLQVHRRPSNLANGNTYDLQGRLLTCEHAASRVVREEPDGTLTVLASHFQGMELNSPNDIIVRSDGKIYFTDPNFGRRPTRFGRPRPQQLPFQAVFCLEPNANKLLPVTTQLEQPNGLCFSRDEQKLFVSDSAGRQIWAFDVQQDGTLQNGQVWAEFHDEGLGVPDGMKIDSEGNLYCCGPGGIHVFDPSGFRLAIIHMPEQTANLCWGDDDLRSLYITASTTLYRMRVNIRGQSMNIISASNCPNAEQERIHT